MKLDVPITLQGTYQTFHYKTWLAPGVGPVQQRFVIATSAGLYISSREELESFSKG